MVLVGPIILAAWVLRDIYRDRTRLASNDPRMCFEPSLVGLKGGTAMKNKNTKEQGNDIAHQSAKLRWEKN
jgi:hypothetical protein